MQAPILHWLDPTRSFFSVSYYFPWILSIKLESHAKIFHASDLSYRLHLDPFLIFLTFHKSFSIAYPVLLCFCGPIIFLFLVFVIFWPVCWDSIGLCVTVAVESIFDTDCICHAGLWDVACTHIISLYLLLNCCYLLTWKVWNDMIKGMFLEVLEPYILKDMLGSLPPEVSSIRIYQC